MAILYHMRVERLAVRARRDDVEVDRGWLFLIELVGQGERNER